MKLDKAIEILSVYLTGADGADPVYFDKAVKLGTEALKRHKRNSQSFEPNVVKPLPGETKE